MKSLYFIVATTLVASIAAALYTTSNEQSCAKAKPYRIAIFTPITHAALEEIEQGFKETLLSHAKDATYAFTTFNANGNKTLQRAQADEIGNQAYDLVFTIGTGCTQILAELAKKKGKTTPQVFCSVDDPVGMHIVDSLASSGNHITGVIEGADYEKQLAVLLALKPDTKNVLLVYDPGVGSGLEKDKQQLATLFSRHGLTLKSVEIYQANEIQQKVTGLLPGIDIVLVLKDNTVVSGIDSLVTLCNRYNTTLFVSDLNSGKKGAALAYGITERESGVGAATKALEILLQGKKPRELPITPVEKFRVEINTNTMQVQNVQIDPATLASIQKTGSIKEQS